jgi:hypothetical protein
MDVRPDSSDPGLECRPTPIPEDHIAIAKPRRPDDLVYCEPKKLLSELAPEPAQPGELCENTLAPFETERSLKDFVPKIIRFVALGLLAFALWQGVSHLSILDRVILGSGDDASKATLQLEEMSKKLDAMSRQLAESLASRNNEPATKADIDRKAQELKPKISSAVKAASCAGKPNGAVCAVIPNVGTGYCSAGTCSNFTAQ